MPRTDDDYEDDPPRRRGGAEFPPGVKFAGIVWLGVGSIGVIMAIVGLVVSFMNNAAQAPAGQGGAPAFCGPACYALIALVFLMVGIQTLKGTAKSTLGNGIGSIIFGVGGLVIAVLLFAVGGFVPGAGVIGTVFGAVWTLIGLGLLLAGVLALMGKSQYEDWRASQGMVKKKRRTQEERDFDEDRPKRRRRDADDDERPRRRRRDEDDE